LLVEATVADSSRRPVQRMKTLVVRSCALLFIAQTAVYNSVTLRALRYEQTIHQSRQNAARLYNTDRLLPVLQPIREIAD